MIAANGAPPRDGGRVLTILYGLACLGFLAGLAYNHLQMVVFPAPLDYLEPIALATTAVIAAGVNPYAFASQPELSYFYPPLTNIVTAPLTWLFGNTLPLNRAVVGCFIVVSCLLCYGMIFRASRSVLHSVAGALICYAGLLYYSTPIAGPNGLGTALFLASVYIPWSRGFSNRSLAVALVLGVLAFYAKQYCVAGLGYVALYMFLAVSKRRAVLFGLASAAAMLASLAVVVYTSPYFLDNTVLAINATTKRFASWATLWQQLTEFAALYLPLWAALALLLGGALWRRLRSGVGSGQARAGGYLNLTDLEAPLLRRAPDFLWLCCACSVLITIASLGRNPGNHLTYMFQLITPFLVAGTMALLSRAGRLQWLGTALMLGTLYSAYAVLPKDFAVDDRPWQQVRKIVAENQTIYAPPIVLQELVSAGRPVYFNGGTSYFRPTGEHLPSLFPREPELTVDHIWERYVNEMHDMIRNQAFDVVMLDAMTPMVTMPMIATGFEIIALVEGTAPAQKAARRQVVALLRKYYQRTATITLPLAERRGGGKHEVSVWTPRPSVARQVPDHVGAQLPHRGAAEQGE